MIYGIGTDLTMLSRISAALDRFGDRFAQRILGPEEFERFKIRRAKVPIRGLRYLATRFAAKEAYSKALGLGIHMPMTWRAVQFLNDRSGRPVAVPNGALKEYVEERGLISHVSMTDESDYAIAFVVLEKK